MGRIERNEAARLLLEHDNILILTHKKPDGDTLGSGFGLLWALESLGKRARVDNAEGFPARYQFIYGDYVPAEFTPEYIVTVDVASPELLGSLKEVWQGRIDLCIDHHAMNSIEATHKLVDSSVPAASLILFDIVKELGVPLDKRIATALFTGISTDTGCFKYYSVTPQTHRAAAELIEAGVDHGLINMLMFDQMSRARIALDAEIKSTLSYHFGGNLAAITISREAVDRFGVDDADLDGISSFPRRIEGVLVGVTLREKEGCYRVSVRTREGLDAAALCAKFGGGGHKAAAGCSIDGDEATVKAVFLPAVEEMLRAAGYSWMD